ncbi:MAG: tRNA uridine-5-carboxymethylaminomethyl(34) synthesis GTPase MnmE, partial [Syntrophales bacterium LBB04]|nr:tRNA uridine-5-carboxymethylaminomethyl(34) synthesis GTPase MnmE [Syntrophales bacterium LBB04]
EIYCHGGYLILQTVLNEIIKMGCRPALPGEFTRRAFLNNRLDLTQAEAVSDMILARTEKGLELALSQLKGNLSEKIEGLRGKIISVLAELESNIDFTEDEASRDICAAAKDTAGVISDIIRELKDILSTYNRGRCFQSGVNVVIFGKPNVGKSSLLNALLGEERAIVTSIPGTTRDFIEEFIEINGVPVKLTDTAGIREPENIIEQEGIRLLREKLFTADLIVILLDGSEGLTDLDRNILHENQGRRIIAAINKCDLSPMLDIRELETIIPDVKILRISAKFGQGLSLLKDAIHGAVTGFEGDILSTVMITNIRHKIALEKAVNFLSRTRNGFIMNSPIELIAIDIRDALSSLSEIIRPTTNEEVLDEIFANFCIGK